MFLFGESPNFVVRANYSKGEPKTPVMTKFEFQAAIREGIPNPLPPKKAYEPAINHAPKRKDMLSKAEKIQALKNALRFFYALKPAHVQHGYTGLKMRFHH